jgi:hypothetical protein
MASKAPRGPPPYPFPICTGVRGRGVLRTSALGGSRKSARTLGAPRVLGGGAASGASASGRWHRRGAAER